MLADRKTRANVVAMRKAAKILGVDAPSTRGPKSDQELLGSLRLEVGKRLKALPAKEHVKCGVCGEIATDHTPFCPYCGDEGDDKPEVVVAAKPAKPAKIKPASPVVEDDDGDLDDDAVDQADVDDEDDETEADEEADEETDEETPEADADEDEDEDSESEESDDESDEESEDDTAETVGISGTGTAVTKDVDAALQVQATELDRVLEDINRLKRNAVTLSYDIGQKCREIRDKQLFKARGHTSFKEFAETELPFRRESALQLIAIVEKHTREEYEQIGFSKLRIISAVNDNGTREELLEAARNGASKRELTERVSGPTPKKGKEKDPAEEKGERITLLGKIGAKRQVVSLKSAPNGEAVPHAGTFYAKGLVSNAYGEIEISEGVFLRIGLKVSATNELKGFTTRFVRASDTE